MKIFMTIVRVAVALVAAVVLFVVPFWVQNPNGTTIDPAGALIDAVAAIVLIGIVVWMWVDRKNLA